MSRGSSISRHESDRSQFGAIVADRGAPQRHIWRANNISATADRCGTFEVTRRSKGSSERTGNEVVAERLLPGQRCLDTGA